MDADDMTTRPTIETVLERITSIGENLGRQIDSLRQATDFIRQGFESRFDNLENQLNTRIDLLEQRLLSQIEEIRLILRDFSRKIDALNKNFLQLQADQLDLRECP